MKLLDTCFLIDLQRELKRREAGPATRFLRSHPGESFAISVVTVTEFLEGFDEPAAGERLLRPFPWLEVTAEVARRAARIRRDLRLRGERIGDFDILIAATAQVADCPLVTDNTAHFARITALTVEHYR